MIRALSLCCGVAISANVLAQTADDAASHSVREFDRANAVLHCYFLAQLADIPRQDDYLVEGIRMTKHAVSKVLDFVEERNVPFCGNDRSCELILEHGGPNVLVGIIIQQASDNVEFQKHQEIERRIDQSEQLNLKYWALNQFRISNCELLLP